MIVCQCRVVSDRDIAAALDSGAGTLARVCRATGAGSECGGCVLGVRAAMADYSRSNPCPLHAVPTLEPALVGGSAATLAGPATTETKANEDTDAATQPPRRRVA